MTIDDDEVWALGALTGLVGMGPRRLRAVLSERSAVSAWQTICRGNLTVSPEHAAVFSGRLPALRREWANQSRERGPDELFRRCRQLGVVALPYGSAEYPLALLEDPDPPLMLFVQGALSALERPAAAVVGTRRATPYGNSVATDLGYQLAEAGVAVVSGLASGIDGAAHKGALRAEDGAPPIGVVGSGLDVVYPPRHRALWHEVAHKGALFSEAPPGTHPENWRFPARNRIIAALSQVVVVVESPLEGGSMITVTEALKRQRQVVAVPGSIYSPASIGTNKLIYDGCTPLCSVADVLDLLQRPRRSAEALEQSSAEQPSSSDIGDEQHEAVLAAVGWEPVLLDDIAVRSGLPLPQVLATIEHLVNQGQLARDSGFLRRISAPNADRRRHAGRAQ